MKLLIDAQLPRRLVYRFREAGHDALHTLDLPLGNRTPDEELVAIAVRDQRILVTKDAGFVATHVLRGVPRLLLISTGNCTNAELEALLLPHLGAIAEALRERDFVELTRRALIVHG